MNGVIADVVMRWQDCEPRSKLRILRDITAIPLLRPLALQAFTCVCSHADYRTTFTIMTNDMSCYPLYVPVLAHEYIFPL